jgi:4-alpha-glucanotransferase
MWFIPPLQDILHLSQKYYAEDSKEERINIPGTVTQFNWTYRMPVCIEELSKNKEIISNIKLLSRS